MGQNETPGTESSACMRGLLSFLWMVNAYVEFCLYWKRARSYQMPSFVPTMIHTVYSLVFCIHGMESLPVGRIQWMMLFVCFITLIWICSKLMLARICVCVYNEWCYCSLTLILLMWRIWWALDNASKWQMGFNSAFKWLITRRNTHSVISEAEFSLEPPTNIAWWCKQRQTLDVLDTGHLSVHVWITNSSLSELCTTGLSTTRTQLESKVVGTWQIKLIAQTWRTKRRVYLEAAENKSIPRLERNMTKSEIWLLLTV
jgi:hypothetical protein